MKTLHFSIIVLAFIILILSNWAQVEGRIVTQTVMQLYKESDMILVGNVTSVEIDSSGIHTFYHVKVEQYLKSQQQNDTITVVGSGPNGGNGPPDPKFMVGDRVRLYLYKEDGMYMISMYSTNANPKCYAHELLGLGPRELIPRGEHAPNYSERNCGPPFQFSSYPHTTFLPSTIQFQSGIQASSIACNEGLQLIIKNENNLPACVKQDTAQKLVEREWGILANSVTKQTSNTSSALKLYLSTNSTIILSGQPIGITISVNNTLSSPINVTAQDNWSYEKVSTGPCARVGYGISVLDGYYIADNITQGKFLRMFPIGLLCPVIGEHAKVYEFQPQSSQVKEVKCNEIQDTVCNPQTYQMGHNYGFNGYLEYDKIQPFRSGIYTIVGADEWGHIAIQHFVVTNSTTG